MVSLDRLCCLPLIVDLKIAGQGSVCDFSSSSLLHVLSAFGEGRRAVVVRSRDVCPSVCLATLNTEFFVGFGMLYAFGPLVDENASSYGTL